METQTSYSQWQPSCMRKIFEKTQAKDFIEACSNIDNLSTQEVSKKVLFIREQIAQIILPTLSRLGLLSNDEWFQVLNEAIAPQKKIENILSKLKKAGFMDDFAGADKFHRVHEEVRKLLPSPEQQNEAWSTETFRSSNSCIFTVSHDRRINGEILRLGEGGPLWKEEKKIQNIAELNPDLLENSCFREALKKAKKHKISSGNEGDLIQNKVEMPPLQREINGRVYYFNLFVSYLGEELYGEDDKYALYLHDVSIKKKAADIFDNNPTPVGRFERDTTLAFSRFVNKAFLQFFPNTKVSDSVFDIFSELNLPQNKEIVENLQPGDTHMFQQNVSCKALNNRDIDITLNCSIHLSQDNDAFFVFSSNITAFTELVEEIKQRNDELKKMLDDKKLLIRQQEKALKRKDEAFLGELSKNKSLEEMVQEFKELNQRLENLANTDGLTQISNRRAFNKKLDEEINRSKRYGDSLSLIMMDIDFFKQFNDLYGHEMGDEVLRKLGALLRQKTRTVDFPARYGGEEFVVILPNTNLEEATMAAEKLRKDIENIALKTGQDQTLRVTASLGVAEWCEKEDQDSLNKRVDDALYYSKEKGRNRVTVYNTENMNAILESRTGQAKC